MVWHGTNLFCQVLKDIKDRGRASKKSRRKSCERHSETYVLWPVQIGKAANKNKSWKAAVQHTQRESRNACKIWLESFKGKKGIGWSIILITNLEKQFVYYVHLPQDRVEWHWFHSSSSDKKNCQIHSGLLCQRSWVQDCLQGSAICEHVISLFVYGLSGTIIIGARVILPAARTNTQNITDSQPYYCIRY